jgi:hypothetical protein
MVRKAKQHVRVEHNDSRHPGTVYVQMPGNVMGTRMSVHEAAELSESLRFAVVMSGYEFVARRRR